MFTPCAKLVLISTTLSVIIVVSEQSVSGLDKNITNNELQQSFDSGCGRIYTQEQFILDSPLYPSNYPLNYQCAYLIKGPTCPTYFTLEFLDFNLENSSGCENDRLEIGDQDALCGSKNGMKTYFSNKGSLILRLVSNNITSGRGYRIIITRYPCDQLPKDITNESSIQRTISQGNGMPDWYTTNKDAEYTTTTKKPSTTTMEYPFLGGNTQKCCQTSYTHKQFVITSPNFPNSMKSETECIYEVFKNTPNVCRLRIHVKFFWLGDNDQNCRGGYLQIDGKYICGCKTDLKLISPFENEDRKYLKFVSRGYEMTSFSGFVLEIIQDDCPNKYTPAATREVQNSTFRFYEDRSNRVTFPQKGATIARLKLVGENTEIINEDKFIPGPKIIQHVYIFADPEIRDIFPKSGDREETSYIHTASSNTVLQDAFNYNYCLNWNRRQLNFLPTKSLSSTCVTYNFADSNIASNDCVDLSYQRGFFKSPYFPIFYPPNMNMCYRFRKLPGYCAVRVYMKSFDLETSDNCVKDYLLFGNQYKYCGDRLRGSISTMDMTGKQFEDVRFVTDSGYCGHGFFGTYEQIECEPVNNRPINPPTYLPPTPAPNQPCSRTIREKEFTLDVFDYHESSCSFRIQKYTEDVCEVRLYFEHFNLKCAYESLVVEGRMYCGSMTGNTVTIDIADDALISYRRTSNVDNRGLRFRIVGVQVADDCPHIDVTAQRFIQRKSLNIAENSGVILKMSHQFREICGVVTNSTQTELPSTLCDLIKRGENNVTECVPLAENSLFVPLHSQQSLELKIRTATTSEEIVFEEVDCDKFS